MCVRRPDYLRKRRAKSEARYSAPAWRAAFRAAFRPRLARKWRRHATGGRIRPRRHGLGPWALRRDAKHDPSKTAGACPELLPASRHHPGGQQGDAGGGVRSDPYCGVWGATLAPTVVHARGSAPRRLVTRPFFHGLAPQQHTRLRALDLATPAVAVDAQQVKQRTCSSARAARGRGCRITRGWRAEARCSRPRGASGVLAKLLGSKGGGS